MRRGIPAAGSTMGGPLTGPEAIGGGFIGGILFSRCPDSVLSCHLAGAFGASEVVHVGQLLRCRWRLMDRLMCRALLVVQLDP